MKIDKNNTVYVRKWSEEWENARTKLINSNCDLDIPIVEKTIERKEKTGDKRESNRNS